MKEWNLTPEVEELHQDALVWDNIFPFFDLYLYSGSMTGAQAGLFDPKYKALDEYSSNGCNFVGLTIGGSRTNVAETMRIIANNRSFFGAAKDRYVLATTADAVLDAKRDGKTAVAFNFQGSDSLEGNVDLVEVYYQLGVRQMLLCYNVRNAAGSGCHEANDDGLSAFGKAVIAQMNALGMVVDASHTGRRTVKDIFEVSNGPVVFSHSNPSGLQAHPRNIDDDQMRACAETGGVIGVVGFDGFLPGRQARLSGLADVIDYAVEVAGVDHVGLGLDWIYCEDMFRQALAANTTAFPSGKSGDYATASEFLGPSVLPQLTAELVGRGYDVPSIRKILGENWLRVARQVWK
jgi:membrane dipeptidase